MITDYPENVGLSSSRLKRISEVTSSYVDSQKLPGTITLVARRGKVVHFECKGMMDMEKKQAMTEDAIFQIFSMTKPITSVVILKMYEQGLLDLNTPLSKFIPAFKNTEVYVSGTEDDYKTVKPDREITICDLLKHTSGLSYGYFKLSVVDQLYTKNGIGPEYKDCTLEEYVETIARMPLVFSPGTKWNYSVSTDVLGRVIEVVSGKKLGAYFKENIFDPLGMVDTGFFVPEEKQNRLAMMYAHRKFLPAEITNKYPDKTIFPIPEATKRARHPDWPLLEAGGGIVSTASDYLKFMNMMLNKGRYGDEFLLSPKTIELMTANHMPSDLNSFSAHDMGGMAPVGGGFGLGVAVLIDPVKGSILGTPGEYHWSGSAHTSFFIDPKEELIGMILTQALPPGAFTINKQFRTAVFQSLID